MPKFDKKRKERDEDKKKEDCSTSDSGPDDLELPSKKKVATVVKVADSDDGVSFLLSKNKHISVRSFKGSVLVDIREFYEAGGVIKPGRKGIALSPVQWEQLKSKIPEVDSAIKEKI